MALIPSPHELPSHLPPHLVHPARARGAGMVQESETSDEMQAFLRAVGIELLQSPDSLLGRSSRGHSVHIATWHGRTVAVKLGSEGLLSPQDLPPHPNVARILASHSEPGREVELRELCEGGELYDRIAEEGPMLADDALDIFRQVASAMEHCHAHGLVHGQLRPEHVLLGAYDEAKLVGFTRPPPDASAKMVRLRPVRALDAPELQGRSDEVANLFAVLRRIQGRWVALTALMRRPCGKQ